MVKVDRTRTASLLLLGALSLAALAGCASTPTAVPGTYPELTLAETKSPAQLLRNEAAERLPAEVIADVVESEDVSVACLSEKEDPDGTIRSWHSTVSVLVNEGSADVAVLARDLVATFEAQEWKARDLGGNASLVKKLLEHDSILADIQISGLSPDENRSSTSTEEFVDVPTVLISVHGPCVRTAGTGSDEVTGLEKR